MARDLHDGLGANLTQLTLLADLGSHSNADPLELQERLRKISTSTREVLHSVKDVLWSARPRNDSLESLVARICQQAERWTEINEDINCRFYLPPEIPDIPLSPEQRQNIFQLCKEALTNAAKHAQATEVRVRLCSTDAEITVTIEDNGHGFDPNSLPKSNDGQAGSQSGHGLENMRERAHLVGGKLEIASLPNEGTQIILRLPINPKTIKHPRLP